MFVPEEFAMTTAKSHEPAGLTVPEVRHAEVNSRRSVFCSGSLDRRAQVDLCNLLQSATPTDLQWMPLPRWGTINSTMPHLVCC